MTDEELLLQIIDALEERVRKYSTGAVGVIKSQVSEEMRAYIKSNQFPVELLEEAHKRINLDEFLLKKIEEKLGEIDFQKLTDVIKLEKRLDLIEGLQKTLNQRYQTFSGQAYTKKDVKADLTSMHRAIRRIEDRSTNLYNYITKENSKFRDAFPSRPRLEIVEDKP